MKFRASIARKRKGGRKGRGGPVLEGQEGVGALQTGRLRRKKGEAFSPLLKGGGRGD